MQIAKVVGTLISSIKEETLVGRKLLLLRPADEKGVPYGKPFVAVDSVNAGIGDLVLTASGSSARLTHATQDRPVDTVIMAMIDTLEVDGKSTFTKS